MPVKPREGRLTSIQLFNRFCLYERKIHPELSPQIAFDKMHKQIQISLHCSEVGIVKYIRNFSFCFLFVNGDGNITGVISEIEFLSKPFTNHEKTGRVL